MFGRKFNSLEYLKNIKVEDKYIVNIYVNSYYYEYNWIL